MRVAAVQINAHADGQENREKMETSVERLMTRDRPDLIVFPEYTPFISSDPEILRTNAEEAGRGPACELIASLAAKHEVNIHLGSLVERDGDRFYNTSFLFDRSGAIIGRYRKIHRFDVTLPNGTEILESAMVEAGDQLEVVEIDGVKFGFSICYDLRFGELFRELQRRGAEVLLIPAAFTQQTGIDHWEILLRARAIENQCFVVAPGQIGSYDQGARTSFGHTMIIDPWGLVIAQASNQEGAITADIDLDYLKAVRAKLPALTHRVLG
jgi:nitrilase